MRAARPHAAAALGAVALSALAVFGGLLLLLVPGVWLMVRLYFGVQAAVLEGLPAFDALQRSGALVRGRWWPTAWRQLVCFAATSALGFPAGRALDALDPAPVIGLAASIALQCALLSVTALYTTLLFLSLRDGDG